MRLRLEVVRHGLPPIKVVWNATPKLSIAELLQELNAFVPLEADEWDLDDYTLQIGGFETLHYQLVGDVLKEDEEIVLVTVILQY